MRQAKQDSIRFAPPVVPLVVEGESYCCSIVKYHFIKCTNFVVHQIDGHACRYLA